LRKPKPCVVSQIEKFHSTSFQRRKHSGNDSIRAPKKDDTDTASDGYEKPQKPVDSPDPPHERPTSSDNSILSASHSESNNEHGTRQSASSTQGQENHSLPYNFENYSRFFRRLALAAPNLHRPTRDDFLRVADGFWQRLRIRFRWFTIRSFRKFNADDISGIITWILMSQTLWILVGT